MAITTGHTRCTEHVETVATLFVEIVGRDGAPDRAIVEGDTRLPNLNIDTEVFRDFAEVDVSADENRTIGKGLDNFIIGLRAGKILNDLSCRGVENGAAVGQAGDDAGTIAGATEVEGARRLAGVGLNQLQVRIGTYLYFGIGERRDPGSLILAENNRRRMECGAGDADGRRVSSCPAEACGSTASMSSEPSLRMWMKSC